jgi:hypothetical protein
VGHVRLGAEPGDLAAQPLSTTQPLSTINRTVTNTGTAPISGWSIGFTFPGDQTITSAWNAAITQSGSTVTAADLAYNRVLNPAAATSFGLQGTWHTSDAPPTGFTLNGRTC